MRKTLGEPIIFLVALHETSSVLRLVSFLASMYCTAAMTESTSLPGLASPLSSVSEFLSSELSAASAFLIASSAAYLGEVRRDQARSGEKL